MCKYRASAHAGRAAASAEDGNKQASHYFGAAVQHVRHQLATEQCMQGHACLALPLSLATRSRALTPSSKSMAPIPALTKTYTTLCKRVRLSVVAHALSRELVEDITHTRLLQQGLPLNSSTDPLLQYFFFFGFLLRSSEQS